MWVDKCISTLVGDVIDDSLEAIKIGRIKRASQTGGGGREALHKECNAESIESLACSESARTRDDVQDTLSPMK